jgi:deoxyribodipyrimidine photolyase-related protein
MKKLRLILGDQLNYNHSWYTEKNDATIYVLMEMRQETDYVAHHVQKIIAFFASMYNFADYLRKAGHQVVHLKINDSDNTQSLTDNLLHLFQNHGIEKFEYQLPDEYRLDVQLTDFCKTLNMPSEAFDSEHFMTTRDELATFFEGKKTYLMETFYRSMRKKYDIMMDGKDPEGGQWNYDAANRKPFKGDVKSVETALFDHDYRDILTEIDKAQVKYIGKADAQHFTWATSRKEALQVLDFFLKNLFANFGNYQDAMHTQHWSLFHARISFALNAKILSPLEVVQAAVEYWRAHKDNVSIEQCEGFIRQIIGWREYMRGVYWAKMPEYAQLNYFNHTRSLPTWFWTGETKMNCLKHAVGQSLDHAYAHHIQRLMVTGNFALLAGIHPDEVDKWYLGVYIDAIEWVEITNTRGMSQFADGGIVGTKPYVSSANYVDKMSNYCTGCYYKKTEKLGEKACPFNSLYWHFYERNRDLLERNPRIGMMYQILKKMNPDEKAKIMEQAEGYLAILDDL